MVPNDGGSKNMPPNYGNLGDHQKVPFSATGGWTEWSHIIIMCVHTKLLTETVCPGSSGKNWNYLPIFSQVELCMNKK